MLYYKPLNIMNTLTNKQKDICAYTGLFGALLNATCLIQLMIIIRDHWISYALLGVFLFSTLAFILLGLLKSIAPWLLIICATFLFAAELVFLTSGVFSLVVILSFIYSVVIVVVLFIERLPQKLKEKALAERTEAMAWRDKL
jgi:hypothetical protein